MKPLMKVALYILVLFLSAYTGTAAEVQLKHRGFAGFSYRAITKADMDSLQLADTKGLIVTRVFPNTPAAKAGIQTGDIIKRYDQNAITDVSQFVNISRLYFAGDRIQVFLERNGRSIATTLTLAAFPEESSDQLDIEYTSFSNKEFSLRAVITSPLHSKKKKLPALLIVSALSSPRLIGVPYYSMPRNVAYAIAPKGFRVMRFELRGFGDSEGEDFRTTDFYTEVNDNLAALDYLMSRDDVDQNNVFVMGHSTDGVVAAILAGKRDVAGLITSCTIGRTFYERLVETVRLQGQLAGESGSEIDKKIKDYLFLTTSVARGESLTTILRKNPGLSRFVNKNNRIMDDRTVEYWRQLLNLNLSEVYSKISEPVLIIYGASDFLTQRAGHEHIKNVLLAAGVRDVSLTVIPNLDHAYAYAKDKKESFQNYKTRNFQPHPEAIKKIIHWMRKHVKR